jgi:hypothetical protein
LKWEAKLPGLGQQAQLVVHTDQSKFLCTLDPLTEEASRFFWATQRYPLEG